jgi:hypothetical protein
MDSSGSGIRISGNLAEIYGESFRKELQLNTRSQSIFDVYHWKSLPSLAVNNSLVALSVPHPSHEPKPNIHLSLPPSKK